MLLTLRIQLAYIKKPPVWRKITVPAQFTFYRLHLIIQAAFGWDNYHLYQFSDKDYGSDVVISEPTGDDWHEVRNSRKVKVGSVLNTAGQKYQYIYDFGDDWLHYITVEKAEDIEATKAHCIGGKGTCPPEDCGGPWGYENLREILANPKHPEHDEMKEWLGLDGNEKWDSNYFDLEEANAMIAAL